MSRTLRLVIHILSRTPVVRTLLLLTLFLLPHSPAAFAQDYSDFNPDIAVAPDGHTYMAWFQLTDGSQVGRIRIHKFDTNGDPVWAAPMQGHNMTIGWLSGWEQTPKIIYAEGFLFLLWARSGGGDLVMQRFGPDGLLQFLAIDRQVNVDQPPEYLGYDMQGDGNGFIYINFQRHGPSGRASFCQKVDLMAQPQWAQDMPCGQGSNQANQRLTVSPSGYVYTANIGGQSSLMRIDPADGSQVWAITPSISAYDIQTGPADEIIMAGRSGDDVVVQIYNPDGTAAGGAMTVSSGADQPGDIRLALDPNGDIHVTWSDDRPGFWGFDDDVYYNRLTSGGMRVFTDDIRMNRLDIAEQYEPEIVADGAGGAWITWAQQWTPPGPAIFVNHVNAAGNRLKPFDRLVSLANPFPFGDVNGDGNLTSLDASQAARHAVGLLTLVDQPFLRADVNGDNSVTSLDASQIARKVVGLITAFPVEP